MTQNRFLIKTLCKQIWQHRSCGIFINDDEIQMFNCLFKTYIYINRCALIEFCLKQRTFNSFVA